MDHDRRALLRSVGLGAGAAIAGCLGMGNGGNGTSTPTPDGGGLVDSNTLPFTVRNDPGWRGDAIGYAVFVDSETRQRAAMATFSPDEGRHDDIADFLEGIDYESERLVVVESGGPDACHGRLDVADVQLREGTLRATATVVDTSDEDDACATVETYPSTLLRVSFDGPPVDEAAIAVTDGWDESATVRATTDDPLSPDPGDLPGHVRPGSDPTPVGPLECDRDDVKRHDQWYDEGDVAWGDVEADGEADGGTLLSLRVEDTEYQYGDTVRVQLTNVSDEHVSTGNRAKYNIQVYTEAGWQDLRVKDEDDYFEYTDDAVGHPPGEGFGWTFELTEDGLVEGTYHDDAEVCPDLQSGRYRFAYFGVIGDGAVAVSFDVDA